MNDTRSRRRLEKYIPLGKVKIMLKYSIHENNRGKTSPPLTSVPVISLSGPSALTTHHLASGLRSVHRVKTQELVTKGCTWGVGVGTL